MSDIELPDSPVGRRAIWLLRELSGAAAPATDARAAEAIAGDDPQGALTWLRREVPGAALERFEADGSALLLYVKSSRGRRHQLRVDIEEDAPHRLTTLHLRRALPDGMEVRNADDSDNDAILAICRRTPVVLGSAEITIDPGPDYFAYMRLMENRMPLVVTEAGRAIAIHCAVVYPALIAAEPVRIALVLHSRVLPEYTRLGIWSVMQQTVREQGRASYSEWDDTPQDRDVKPEPVVGAAYMALENESAHGLTGQAATWSCRPYRVTVPCAIADAGEASAAARPATPDDAARIVEILNACHEGEELYRPYTVESLTARLVRAPELYGWDNVLLADGAVLGVWHAGQRRTRKEGESEEVSVRSLVLDYGFLPGHESEFERLLRSAAGTARERGHTHLSVFTSDPSRGSGVLRTLSDRMETYELITPELSEPAGAVERGVYVDQIYF